ncbi:hypothetical protein CYK00_02355 [Neisseria sicca]|uniref:Uncharacterized protein n=1 Tax=Neisseria sicca TaxID=490 RepID=A0A2I1XE19_NEISI|nr:hypothetical protein CYK00_02355 [Neisseria sicca]
MSWCVLYILLSDFRRPWGLRSKRSSENAYSILCLMCSNDFYSGLTLNQYGVASPCRTICTVCGFVALS